ncbi:DUF892 family protein [Chitinophaga sedimenti]|nr:DUF892 family protein [Chitinophaga sedimenti]MCK7558496.1 DUF892 family protein [Chitinophaga sedimenti]
MATKTATRSSKATNGRSTAARSTTKKKVSESMENSKFHELFMEELKDIYWAEKHLVKALPKMQKGATTEDLATCIGNHLEETKEHVARLEQIFEMLGKRPQAKNVKPWKG